MNDRPTTVEKKKAFLKALEQSLGIVEVAARACEIAASTHHRWMNKDKRYREKVIAMREIKLDYVESKAIENIKANDTAMIIFYLKKLGKSRGFGDDDGQLPDEQQQLVITHRRPVKEPTVIQIEAPTDAD